jgi:3-phenylpropionate/trans-cinnamate dioxygenase ferredoxin subunit
MSEPSREPTWTRLCALDELEVDAAVRLEVAGSRLAVVRLGDDVYVIGDRCSHADFSLSEGEVDVDDCTIECPKHGSAFGLVDGLPRSLPAMRPVPVYSVRIDHGDVFVTVEGTAPTRPNHGASR